MTLRDLIKPEKLEAFDRLLPAAQEWFATQDDWLTEPGKIKYWLCGTSDRQLKRESSWCGGPFLSTEGAAQILGVDIDTLIEGSESDRIRGAFKSPEGDYKFIRCLFCEAIGEFKYRTDLQSNREELDGAQ